MNQDKDDIGKLWDKVTPKLYGYLINALRDEVLADDILQNTWLKAIVALPGFNKNGAGSFPAWLFAIAKNEMKMHWRTAGREIRYDETLHDHSNNDHGTDNKILVDQILNKLSLDDQELIRLYYIGGLSSNEVAKMLKINPITARVRMHRALAHARNVIKN